MVRGLFFLSLCASLHAMRWFNSFSGIFIQKHLGQTEVRPSCFVRIGEKGHGIGRVRNVSLWLVAQLFDSQNLNCFPSRFLQPIYCAISSSFYT